MSMPGTIADLPIERFERLERALLGDPEVGHLGAIHRLNLVDELHAGIPEVHRKMDAERIAADRRLHERVDNVDESVDSIERKVDNLRYTVTGAAAAIVGAATWLIFAVA